MGIIGADKVYPCEFCGQGKFQRLFESKDSLMHHVVSAHPSKIPAALKGYENKRVYSFSLTPSIVAKLDTLAAGMGVSRSLVVREILEDAMKEGEGGT